MHEVIEELEGVYGAAVGESSSKIFRGLCTSYKLSYRCFESLLEDGWDDPVQFQDMGTEWRNVLALAPNGSQNRNLEMMLLRVDAGPLDTAIPKAKKAKHDKQPPLETTKSRYGEQRFKT